MTNYVDRALLKINADLAALVENEIAPGTGIDAAQAWAGFAQLVAELTPENLRLLAERDRLQEQIDTWHSAHPGIPDPQAYRSFLESIGYLVREDAGDFSIETSGVDPEIATTAGPQLVVPVMNARFALNAANARWGSLYDALYGTDAIDRTGALMPGKRYNPARGAEVVRRGQQFLDTAVPLDGASHADAVHYFIDGAQLVVALSDGQEVKLRRPEALVGSSIENSTAKIVLVHHGLHIELVFDRSTQVGAASASGLADIVLEAALTTIQDCEDSVAAVDAEDKVVVYRNWLGLMKGDLQERFERDGQQVTRSLLPDRDYVSPTGHPITLSGRSLMLVRNVGHLMTTDAVLDPQGREVLEGMLDAFVTVFCAMHDLRKTSGPRNSRTGSIYIVKPKMHGPEEVVFTNLLFDRVEDIFGLPRHTIKMGIMDEERRTSVNLRQCIRAARHRIVFINTGFLDRTGDEIHTSMLAGPVLPKADIKTANWLLAYESNNVQQGLRTSFRGSGQIGKGMWARPDDMAAMLSTKAEQLRAGASTAWVPSPTAAVLHAMHYHTVDVASAQAGLIDDTTHYQSDILVPPLLDRRNLADHAIAHELSNNVQGILGYVVRWIDQGIGCSKVPDLDDVALMEDRATLRISAQHIANWLAHGLVSEAQVRRTFENMARVVDGQNANDPLYRPIVPDFDQNLAFQAALDLVLKGRTQPNGYTEPLLHQYRRRAKAAAQSDQGKN